MRRKGSHPPCGSRPYRRASSIRRSWVVTSRGAKQRVGGSCETVCLRATRLEGVKVELSYDRAGSRLHRIGDFQISYDKVGSRPKTLGRLALDYDMAGSRLRRVGADQIEYDKLGSRPTQFGNLDIAYDRLGSRLVRFGTLGVEYDMAGNRVRRIGSLTVDYDKLGSRPRYLRADGEEPLDEPMCVVVFLVLVAFAGEA